MKRFLHIMIEYMQSRCNKISNYRFMIHNMNFLFNGLRFYYDDFKTFLINIVKLEVVMNKRLIEDRLIKKRKRLKVWINLIIVRKLLIVYFNDVHINECWSWNIILSRIFYILLYSVMHVRIDNIIKIHLNEYSLFFFVEMTSLWSWLMMNNWRILKLKYSFAMKRCINKRLFRFLN